jgi:hypothetical protein
MMVVRRLFIDLALLDQLGRRELLQDRDRKPDNEAGEEAGLQHTLDHLLVVSDRGS